MVTDPAFLVLLPAVIAASALQAATGIGYGVVAGPIFLVVLNGPQAFQISTVHNLLIAVILAPFVYNHLDRTLLKSLIYGCCLGVPVGFSTLQIVDTTFLKLFSALIVLLIAGYLFINLRRSIGSTGTDRTSTGEQITVGCISGLMGGVLAMPGPVASTWMATRGCTKETVRSTLLVFFVFSYGLIFLSHAVFSHITPNMIALSL